MKPKEIYDFDELLFDLKRAVGHCVDHYRTTGMRVQVSFADNTPDYIVSNVNRLIRKVNEYMHFLDDLNQYESLNQLPPC